MHSSLGLPLAVLVLGTCGGPTDQPRSRDDQPGAPPLLSQLPRALSPAEQRLVGAANTFAFDLLREATRVLPPDSNAFLSPLSASMALGMALNGADGQTLSDMRGGLRLTGMGEAEINQGYRDLTTLLADLDSRTDMRIANSLWVRQRFPIEPAFIQTSRSFFDAEVRNLDFASPGAVRTINDWVSDKTNQRIPRLLEQIGSDEILFLVNAIYFKGKWREAFDPKQTQKGAFHGANGRDRTADLMRQEETLPYDETEDFQAVDLLYGNGAFGMTVLLPKPGRTPGALLNGLNPATWKALNQRLHQAKVNLTLPRFRLDYSRRLNDDLKTLGMAVAFDPGRADFYRIADVRPERLYLSRVEQKAFVEVNEEGTEAAAATGVGVSVTSMPVVHEMKVDRPFVFAIQERLSGTVLFVGMMNTVGQ